MSTNFYAEFRLGDSRDASSVRYRMHIGKATRSSAEVYGISTFSGKHFPDVDSWIKFLSHNTDCVEIVSEYGEPQETEEFIRDFLESELPTSDTQIEWLRNHMDDPGYMISGDRLKIWDEPQPEAWRARYWIDQATGKLFYGGEFS